MDYDNIQAAYSLFSNFCYDNKEAVIAGAAFIVTGGVYELTLRNRRRKLRKIFNKMKTALRGKTMTKEERIAKNKTIQGDAIFESLMNLVETGQQTQYDVNKTLRILSNVLNMPDFVSAKQLELVNLTTEEFELIQSILRSKKAFAELMFKKQKPKIPGPKPHEVDNVMVFPSHNLPKHSFGGNLLKKAARV